MRTSLELPAECLQRDSLLHAVDLLRKLYHQHCERLAKATKKPVRQFYRYPKTLHDYIGRIVSTVRCNRDDIEVEDISVVVSLLFPLQEISEYCSNNYNDPLKTLLEAPVRLSDPDSIVAAILAVYGYVHSQRSADLLRKNVVAIVKDARSRSGFRVYGPFDADSSDFHALAQSQLCNTVWCLSDLLPVPAPSSAARRPRPDELPGPAESTRDDKRIKLEP